MPLRIRNFAITTIVLTAIAPICLYADEPATQPARELHWPADKPTTQQTSLIPLPGNGLAQHDFVYTGEWDTRKPVATLFFVKGGKVVHTYQIPTKDETNGQLSEFSDFTVCSNGDVVFAYKTGWRKIDADNKTIYDYRCPKGDEGWNECHSAQPIGNDKVLFMENGTPSAKLKLFNLTTGKMEMEHEIKTKEPVNQKSVHGQFRNVRMIAGGHYLISHMNLSKVVEYDQDWNEVWSAPAPSVWHATRLKNGNTLISGNQNAFVRELDPKGEVVWEVKDGDLPIKINSVHQAQRLENGNTIICNWTARVKKEDWPKIVQIIEVTPDKQVVWAFREWTDPDLGPSSCFQMLGEAGVPENPGEQMR
jgi:hypothetical protein